MKSISFASVGMILGLSVSAQAALLTNDGGLENWTTNNDLALWVEEGGATVVKDTIDKTEGSASANITLGSNAAVRTGNFGQSMQTDRTYTFSMDYKPLSTTGTEFYVLDVRLWLFGSSGIITTWGPEDFRILNAAETPGLFNTWNDFTFDFGAGTARPIADGTTYAFILVNTWDGTSYAGHIDNLQVTEVPEPASAMLLTGAAALLGLRRRR